MSRGESPVASPFPPVPQGNIWIFVCFFFFFSSLPILSLFLSFVSTSLNRSYFFFAAAATSAAERGQKRTAVFFFLYGKSKRVRMCMRNVSWVWMAQKNLFSPLFWGVPIVRANALNILLPWRRRPVIADREEKISTSSGIHEQRDRHSPNGKNL